MGTKISALPSVSGVGTADLYVLNQGGVTSKLTHSQLLTNLRESLYWFTVDSSKYTSTPASTSRITMSDTTGINVGMPIATTASAIRYGVVKGVSANAYIDIGGEPISGTITALKIGRPNLIEQRIFNISGAYGASVADIYGSVAKRYYRFDHPAGAIVAFSAIHNTPDTGATQPSINIRTPYGLVSTNGSNNGIAMPNSVAWADNPAVAFNAASMYIYAGQYIEIACTVRGTNGNAADLTVSVSIIYAY